MKIILKHILRNIREKKGRSLLIILSLIIATTVFEINLTLPSELVAKVVETMRKVVGDSDIVISSNDEFVLDDINFGDENITYTTMSGANILINDTAALVYGVDIEAAKDMKLIPEDTIIDGEADVIISKAQAKKQGINKGDKITAIYEDNEFELNVAQLVANKGLAALNGDSIILIADAKTVAAIKNDESNKPAMVYIDVKDDDRVNDYADFLDENNSSFHVEKVADVDSLKEQTVFISYIMLMIFAMATIMIMFVVSSLNKIIIAERMPVIGTFRSIGATKGKMNAILILENAMYGLIGGIIGSVFGYLIKGNMSKLFIVAEGVELTEKHAKFDIGLFLLGVFFSVLLQIIISVKAILKANKKPIKDIIFDLQSTQYRVKKSRIIIGTALVLVSFLANILLKDMHIIITMLILVGFISGAAMLEPFFMQLMSKLLGRLFDKANMPSAAIASKNMGYNKMIISSSRVLVVSLSLMLAILTISSSFKNIFTSFKLTLEDYDIIVEYPAKEESEYYKLTELDGVNIVDFQHLYNDMEITYNGGEPFYNIPSFVGMKDSSKNIQELNYKIKDLSGNEILIDEELARKNNISIGDTLNFKFSYLNKELSLKVVGTVNSTLFSISRAIIIVNYDYYIENITKVPIQVWIGADSGTDLKILKEHIKNKMKETGAKISTVDEYLDTQYDQVDSIMSIFYVVIGLAVILSFIGIINNQVISFIQRRKELAVLNSVCMSKGQLRKMLFFETALSNLVGCIMAIAVAFFSTGIMDNFMKGLYVYVKIKFDFSLSLMLAGFIFVILLLTLLNPMKRLRKMNIVEQIKYE